MSITEGPTVPSRTGRVTVLPEFGSVSVAGLLPAVIRNYPQIGIKKDLVVVRRIIGRGKAGRKGLRPAKNGSTKAELRSPSSMSDEHGHCVASPIIAAFERMAVHTLLSDLARSGVMARWGAGKDFA